MTQIIIDGLPLREDELVGFCHDADLVPTEPFIPDTESGFRADIPSKASRCVAARCYVVRSRGKPSIQVVRKVESWSTRACRMFLLDCVECLLRDQNIREDCATMTKELRGCVRTDNRDGMDAIARYHAKLISPANKIPDPQRSIFEALANIAGPRPSSQALWRLFGAHPRIAAVTRRRIKRENALLVWYLTGCPAPHPFLS